jgi:hypothetical protein
VVGLYKLWKWLLPFHIYHNYAVIKVEYNNKTGGLDTIYQTPVDFSFRLPGSYIVENSMGIEEEVRN